MAAGSRPATFVVEGDRNVLALLESAFFDTQKVFLEKDRHPVILERCAVLGVACEELSREALRAHGSPDFLRGACAVVARPGPREPDEAFLSGAKRLLIPVDFSDGGNLGPLIRTACAFGVDGILVEAGRGVDIFSTKCLRSSCQALFECPVFEVPHLGMSLHGLVEAGFILLGVSRSGASLPLCEIKAARRTAVLFGAEDKGLTADVESYCAQLLHLPLQSGGSLNAAAEGSIVLYELFSRGGKSGEGRGGLQGPA